MPSIVSTLTLALAIASGPGTARAVTCSSGNDATAGARDAHTPAKAGSGQPGLRIDGGEFNGGAPHDYTRGVELASGKSIALYNKEKPAQQSNRPDQPHDLYTAAEVQEIFASGDRVRIRKAFTSSDAHGIPPTDLTEVAVLAALNAASTIARARTQTACNIASEAGDVDIHGGSFDFRTGHRNIIAARHGTLNWWGGELASSGGGGDTILLGRAGIHILGGSIKSSGAVDGKLTAIQYDDRHRLDRDRWTLGKYLAFYSNGDINIGTHGEKAGPAIHVSDGMLKIGVVPGSPATGEASHTQHVNLYSGSVTLRGDHRSTLLMLERDFRVAARIDGGTLNVLTRDALVRNHQSPAMWNMKTSLESGTINLVNSELIGPDSTIRGGTVNMSGRSSISSPVGSLGISGGTIKVGPRSFIGAIRGDSKAQSPYPTSQQNLSISGTTLVFKVVAPAHGNELTVGTDIGGIYAGDNNPAKTSHPTLSIASDTVIQLDTSALAKGTYTAPHFASVDAGDGTLRIAAPLRIGGAAQPYIGTLDSNGSLTIMVH